jgi:hypothetical protein
MNTVELLTAKNAFMKYLLSATIVIFSLFFSCTKKESTTDNTPKKCYSCKIGGVAGSYTKDTCVYKWDTPHFTDAQGNNLNWICTPK